MTTKVKAAICNNPTLKVNEINIDPAPLKLYTIYSQPNHPDGTVHKAKSEAEAAEVAEHHR